MSIGTTVDKTQESITYIYDGGLVGFYCCVYESIARKQMPHDILSDKEEQLSLLSTEHIESDMAKAHKIREYIKIKITPQGLRMVENVFLSCMKHKEMAMLQFILKGLKEGEKVLSKIADPTVAKLLEAERHLLGERHLLLGFVRFSDYQGVLVSTITPKNFILPFIAGHFVCRFRNENFIIFDKTHKAALIYKDRKKQIIPIEDFELAEVTEDEENYRTLWKQFYNTVAIKNRYNPKLRISNVPKRYWENMVELKDLL